MLLAFKIAVRFLSSSKAQTLLIALGIAIGVSVQVFIGSLIQGLQRSLIDTTIGRSSHITFSSQKDDRKISDSEAILEKIESQTLALKAVSRVADFPAFIEKGSETFPILVRGFEFDSAEKIYRLNEILVEGEKPSQIRQALMGVDLKKELKAKIGDRVIILTPQGEKTKVTITGFYDFKVSSVNETWIITDLQTAQKIFSFGRAVTAIEIQIDEVFEADRTADLLKAAVNDPDIKVDNWKDQNAQLLSGLKGQSMSSYLIQVFVMISVILGIASVLAITVLQKSRQIGILKAMGIKDHMASFIFLFEGSILGAIGSVLGVGLGLGLTYMFSKFAVNPDGTPIITLYIDYVFIALSAVAALGSASGAALLPARRSARLNPIEVIRNG